MKNYTVISGHQIKDILTRFYYREDQLFFQIVLHFDNHRKIAFKEFTDYTRYKRVIGELQKIKDENLSFRIPETTAKSLTQT